jgi:hypothetical protein
MWLIFIFLIMWLNVIHDYIIDQFSLEDFSQWIAARNSVKWNNSFHWRVSAIFTGDLLNSVIQLNPHFTRTCSSMGPIRTNPFKPKVFASGNGL